MQITNLPSSATINDRQLNNKWTPSNWRWHVMFCICFPKITIHNNTLWYRGHSITCTFKSVIVWVLKLSYTSHYGKCDRLWKVHFKYEQWTLNVVLRNTICLCYLLLYNESELLYSSRPLEILYFCAYLCVVSFSLNNGGEYFCVILKQQQ